MANAIGVLETKGMVALVKGVDAMLKAASVSLAGQYKDVGSAYMSASVVGDVASVKAAVEAGATAASEIGTVVSVHVIARPHDNTAAVLSPKPAKK
jgi:ethanolamine utilization protein EutM